jgi:lipopolysaccharide/colanic/teichoic acid biosynthesis glycosyltransferase
VKRLVDLCIAVPTLVLLSPILAVVCTAIWLQDRRSPFYIAERVGRGFEPFRMVKLRSMVVNADKSGVDSTGANDNRITAVGRLVRKTKLDEVPQLWNVVRGEMSLVGPRPNVAREVNLYTDEERRLLSVRPGITDIASIVFADEGDILADKADPDIAYNQLIRPGKSRLGLFYIDHRTTRTDLTLLRLTVNNSLNRRAALDACAELLRTMGANDELVELASRHGELQASAPPGATEIVTTRAIG